jgi:hypothetical protein
MSDRPNDNALWASVAETLRHTVLPNLTDPHARNVTIHLIGLAVYARQRGDDVTDERSAELAVALGASGGQDVLRSCTAVLADPEHLAYQAVRNVLVRHLDDDLAAEAVLLEAFRGHLPDE